MAFWKRGTGFLEKPLAMELGKEDARTQVQDGPAQGLWGGEDKAKV